MEQAKEQFGDNQVSRRSEPKVKEVIKEVIKEVPVYIDPPVVEKSEIAT